MELVLALAKNSSLLEGRTASSGKRATATKINRRPQPLKQGFWEGFRSSGLWIA
jgi:hypothetical protein